MGWDCLAYKYCWWYCGSAIIQRRSVHLNVLWIIRFCSHHEIKQMIVIPTGIGLAAVLGLEHCPDWLNCVIYSILLGTYLLFFCCKNYSRGR